MIAIAVVVNDAGEVLLQRRIDTVSVGANDKWELPGGKVEYGESPEVTAKRETEEETGCVVTIERCIPFVFSNVWNRVDGTTYQALVVGYVARVVAGLPTSLDAKVAEVGWFSPAEIQNMNVLAGCHPFLKAAGLL